MSRPVLLTPPTDLPVSATECKDHAVVDHDADDLLIETYIRAATDHLDGLRGVLSRCIMSQTWAVEVDKSPFVSGIPDVSAVSVDGIDPADVTIKPVAVGTSIEFPGASLPAKVNITAGFGNASDVPWGLKVAIMQMVRRMYDDRAGVEEAAQGQIMESLIAQYRWAQV